MTKNEKISTLFMLIYLNMWKIPQFSTIKVAGHKYVVLYPTKINDGI